MRIIIITQNEPFYLAENLKYLFSILPKHSKIIGCVVNNVSPFGKKESFVKKSSKTLKIFGFNFFIYYTFKFILNKLNKRKQIKYILRKNQVPIITLDKNINHTESIKKIKNKNPDLLISILGNQIFKKEIIKLAPHGCLNLHTALLPKYRGLMPTFWVLKNNEKYTGVSVFYVDEGIDSGPIIVQKKLAIGEKSQEELIRETKRIGMQLIATAIDLIENDKVELIENDPTKKTYYSFPTNEDVKIFKKLGKKFY